MSDVVGASRTEIPVLHQHSEEAQADFLAFGHTAVNIPIVAELAGTILDKRDEYFGRPHYDQAVLGQFAKLRKAIQRTPLGDICGIVSLGAPTTSTGPNLSGGPVAVELFDLAPSAADKPRLAKPGIIAVVSLAGEFTLNVEDSFTREQSGVQYSMSPGAVAYLGERGVRYQIIGGNSHRTVGLTIGEAVPLPQPPKH
jgi:hypothetical protein